MEKNLRASNGGFGFSCGSDGKESAFNAGDLGSIPGLERSPGEGKGQPPPVFWPAEFHGLYSPWDCKEGLSLSGFTESSVGEESACNAGDPSLISGSGRSTGEGIDYPLQYSWASLVVQLVKNPPSMPETCV